MDDVQEPSPLVGPAVVIAVVIDEPGSDLGVVLQSLADQDYLNSQVVLLLCNSDPAALASINGVAGQFPGIQVHQLDGRRGFASGANEVLHLVQGESGCFLLMRDDVALDKDALRHLVEELGRSNAGIVGPKFIEWDEPQQLQMVGCGADWLGELDNPVEIHEIDQEQHDIVRDVFVLPAQCLLIRADLLRSLEGFDTSLEICGEDLDICWRAHLSGARIVVVPAARARHRSSFPRRQIDLPDARAAIRDRVSTVLSLTGATRLLLVFPLLVLATVVESLWLLVRGHVRQSGKVLGALLGIVPRVASILSRRRRIHALRRVPNSEVVKLQVHGSARLKGLMRQRQSTSSGEVGLGTENRQKPTLVAIATLSGLALLFILGARQFITHGVGSVGDLLAMPSSPSSIFHSYFSGWWDRDLGATESQPTGIMLTAIGGALLLGHMGLLHTIVTIGLIPFGWWGASKLCSVVATQRAHLSGVVAYAAVPLPYAAVASGRHQVLIAYAVIPWALHLMRSFGGIRRSIFDDTPGDVIDHPNTAQRLRIVSQLTLLLAVTTAFSPATVLVIVFCSFLWFIAAVIAGGSLRAAGLGVAAALVGVAGSALLNIPWITRFISSDGWDTAVGNSTSQRADLGWASLMRFEIGSASLGGLIIVLYIPILVALLVSRHSRFVWSTRAAILTIGSIVLAVLSDGGHLPIRLPEVGILLAPAACGLALGTAVMVMSFRVDVRAGRFGWQQPVALLSLLMIPIGFIPAAAASIDGRWNQPSTSLSEQTKELLGSTTAGDFRVLFVGDPQLMVGASHSYGDGLAYSLVNNARATLLDSWTSDSHDLDQLVRPLLDALANRSTDRVGRLMAPLGIRYFVLPMNDGSLSANDVSSRVPQGIIAAFAAQLDLRMVYSPASMMVFENTQWIPVSALLSAVADESSQLGGSSALISADLVGSLAALNGTIDGVSPSQQLPIGSLHLGVPFDDRWHLNVDGKDILGRASFGSVMKFPIASSGLAHLDYRTSVTRYVFVLMQFFLWLVVLVCIVQPRLLRKFFNSGGRTKVVIGQVNP